MALLVRQRLQYFRVIGLPGTNVIARMEIWIGRVVESSRQATSKVSPMKLLPGANCSLNLLLFTGSDLVPYLTYLAIGTTRFSKLREPGSQAS